MIVNEQQSSGLDNYKKGVIIDGKSRCMGFQSNNIKV